MLVKDSHSFKPYNTFSFVLFLPSRSFIPETRNKIDSPDPRAMSLGNERREAADQVTFASFFRVSRDWHLFIPLPDCNRDNLQRKRMRQREREKDRGDRGNNSYIFHSIIRDTLPGSVEIGLRWNARTGYITLSINLSPCSRISRAGVDSAGEKWRGYATLRHALPRGNWK